MHGTVHGPGYSGGDGIGRSFRLSGGERFADDFHEFALEWEPGALRWYVDDLPFSTLTPADLPRGTEWVFDHPFFVILNVAVGGNWPGCPDETTDFPQRLTIDFLRIFRPADVAERFEASFVDDAAGWRRVDLLVGAFARADDQPDGAPQRRSRPRAGVRSGDRLRRRRSGLDRRSAGGGRPIAKPKSPDPARTCRQSRFTSSGSGSIASQPQGSSGSWLSYTPKCRCGGVVPALPLVPTNPITVSGVTRWLS